MKLNMLQMRNLIQCIFAVLVFSVGYLGWQSHEESLKSEKSFNSLIETQTELLVNIEKVTAKSGAVQRFVLRALLESDPQQIPSWREKIQDAREVIKKSLDAIHAEIDLWNNEELQHKFSELTKVRGDYIETSEKVLKLCQEGKNPEARDLNQRENLPHFDRYQAILEEIDEEIKRYSGEQRTIISQTVHQSTERIYSLAILGTIMGIVGSILAAFTLRGVVERIYRSSGEIEQASRQTASASSQVSSASHSLANSASEQASTLEETSASMEEMSSMIKQNAESAKKARVLSGEAHHLTDSGVKQMEELKQAMHEIQEAGTLISKIIKTINEIAFQTNILALNASVEAARAGEHGLGFAVVAEEVRNLALRASNAADDTATKIEASIEKSQLGVEISSNLAISLGKIDGKTKEIDQLITSIASASEEQSRGIDQLNVAIRQIDSVTQGIASSAEETASSSEELKTQSQMMLEQVEALHGIVGSKNKSASVSQVSIATAPAHPQSRPTISQGAKADRIPLPPLKSSEVGRVELKRPPSKEEDFFSDDHDRK